MQHTQNTFKLSQDGETLMFSGDEAICYDDYKSQNDPTETFFDWCKNSYPFTQEAQSKLWDKAALELFYAHNPKSNPEHEVNKRLIAGFRTDMEILSLFFDISPKASPSTNQK